MNRPIPIPARPILPYRSITPYIRPPAPGRKIHGDTRNPVTVAIGLRGRNSFVFAADRLFSHGSTATSGSFGSYGDKIFGQTGFAVSVSVTGAGYADLLRAASDAIINRLGVADDSEPADPSDPTDQGTRLSHRIDCKALIEDELSLLSQKWGGIPELSLLVGVRQDGFGIDFIRSDGLVVQRARDREVLGIGETSLVEFLLDTLYHYDLSDKELVPLAILVVQMAKKYCPQYCAGPTDISVFRYDGFPVIRSIKREAIQQIEQMFDSGIRSQILSLITEVWRSFVRKSSENPSSLT